MEMKQQERQTQRHHQDQQGFTTPEKLNCIIPKSHGHSPRFGRGILHERTGCPAPRRIMNVAATVSVPPSPTSDETTSQSTKQPAKELLAGHPRDGSQVAGYPPEGESDKESLRDAHVNEYSAKRLARRQNVRVSPRVNSTRRMLSPPKISICNRAIFPERNACHNGRA